MKLPESRSPGIVEVLDDVEPVAVELSQRMLKEKVALGELGYRQGAGAATCVLLGAGGAPVEQQLA